MLRGIKAIALEGNVKIVLTNSEIDQIKYSTLK